MFVYEASIGAAFAVDLGPFADDIVSKVDVTIEQLGSHRPSILTLFSCSRRILILLGIFFITLVSQKTVVARRSLTVNFLVLNQERDLGIIIRVVETAHRVAFLLSVADDSVQRTDEFASGEEGEVVASVDDEAIVPGGDVLPFVFVEELQPDGLGG